jgi:hypothetical protein
MKPLPAATLRLTAPVLSLQMSANGASGAVLVRNGIVIKVVGTGTAGEEDEDVHATAIDSAKPRKNRNSSSGKSVGIGFMATVSNPCDNMLAESIASRAERISVGVLTAE